MTSDASTRNYWPGLDGLRGIAAVSVLVFHAQLGFAANGYVGVDVFFALSGFLITSILLGDLDRHGTVRLRRFYLRRLLRLYPALVVTCALVMVLAVLGGQLSQAGAGALAALAYLGNWWMYTGHEAPLLDHVWTLAIEEHFYAVWPVLLLVLGSRRRGPRIAGFMMAAVLLVVLFTPWPQAIAEVRETYLRGFPIVWGSLLAWWVSRRGLAEPPRRLAGVAGSAALVALLAVLLIPWSMPEGWITGPSSLTGALSVLVLAGVTLAPQSLASSALSWSPLRWVGARSYGLYLYHFPVLEVLRHHVNVGPEWARMLIGVFVTLLLTEASFRWVETPILRFKDRRGADTARTRKTASPT